MHGGVGSNEPSPSRVTSPAGSATHHSPASSCPRTPSLRTNVVRSCYNSASSPGSQTAKLKPPAGSGDEGSKDSKFISQDDSETNEEGRDNYEAKPLGMRNAKMVGTLTPKAPKNPAAILKSQAFRAATVPWKLMVRFWPLWYHQQKRPKEKHQLRGTRQMTQNLLVCPHGLMTTTRTLKKSRNVSITRMPGFWTRTLACGVLT